MMDTELTEVGSARRVDKGGSHARPTRRIEPIPFSEKLSNSLIKIIALEDIKDIPKIYGNILIISFFVGLLAVFIYVVATGYKANRSEKFLSLDASVGDCEVVLRPVNGIYMIDSNGYWQGDTQFDYAKGIYSFNFNNFLGSRDEFATLMQSGYEKVQEIALLAGNNSLAINLMYWMVFSASTAWGSTLQQLELTGSPTTIFDRRYYGSSLSNEFGVCDVRSKTVFDKHNGIITITYDIDEFTSSDVCANITNPTHMGYLPFFDGPDFRINLDVRSLITCAAINMGILDPYEIAEVPFTSTTVVADGKTYSVDQFYNPRFPGMKPIYCQRDIDQELLHYNVTYSCVINVGALYLYPTFNHVGSNMTTPSYCDCQQKDPASDYACNTFNFIPSLVFYEFENDYYDSEDSLIRFSFLDGNTGMENNRNVFDAAFDAVVDNDQRYNASWRQEAYAFCAQPQGGCSLLTVLTSDFSNSVSDYYYQVLYGACNNTFTISDEAFDRAQNNPPTSVEERFGLIAFCSITSSITNTV